MEETIRPDRRTGAKKKKITTKKRWSRREGKKGSGERTKKNVEKRGATGLD